MSRSPLPLAPASWRTLALLLAAYALAVWAGLQLLLEPARISIFWPAAGVALAGLLMTPRRQWGVLLVGWFVIHAVAEITGGYATAQVLAFPAISIGEATLGAWLIGRSISGRPTLASRREVLMVVGWMALLAAPASATVAAALQSTQAGEFWHVWRIWWTSEVLGELVMTPAILAAPGAVRRWREGARRLRLEIAVTLVGIVALSAAILGAGSAQASIALSLLVLPYPALVWLALRAGVAEVSIAIAAVSGVAVWCVSHGAGPFMLFQSDPDRQVLVVQVYLASVVVPALFLAASAHEAQEASAQVREIYDHSSEAIFMVGIRPEGEFVYEAMNPRAQAALGPRAPGIGRTPREILPAPAVERVLDGFRRCVATSEPVAFEIELDFGQGPRAWQTSLVPIRDAQGGVRRIAGFARDVTEQRDTERAHAALERQLRQAQKMEAIGRLAGGLAHEFNNTLTAMLGHAELLRDVVPAARRESVDAILEGGQRSAALVRQVLTFSRRQEQPRTSARVQTVVGEAMRLVRATVPSTIEIRESMDLDCPPVLADPTQLHQVLMNLVNNAVYAMRDGPGVLEIRLDCGPIDPAITGLNGPLPPGTYVCLAVSDTGIGMAPETLEFVYEPFFTTKPVGEGSGLGLPMVLGIMQRHEGGVAIESAPGKGTTVRVFFPTIRTETAPRPAPRDPPPRGAGERILFVDDEPSILRFSEHLLGILGYVPVTFGSPILALEAFRARPNDFDAAITDLTMPGMTGVALAAELRRIRPDLPIVIATGVPLTPEEGRLPGVSASEIILKPYSRDTVAQALARALQKVPTGPL